MRHKVAGRRLGRSSDHRLSMYRNMTTDLLRYEKITTTEAKSKEIRVIAEKIITLGKKGDLHSRRLALITVADKKVIDKVFNELATRYINRSGGYTRTIKLGQRIGDGATLARIELVE